jgi:hypothetical protein
MQVSFNVGAWRPDLAQSNHDGLITASNCFAGANGDRPVGGFQAATAALSGFSGGGAFVGADGTSALLAGTATALFRYSGSAWTSLVGSLTAGRWRFAQFVSQVTGFDIAIGVYGGVPVKVNLISGAAATLGGSPPASKFVAVAGDFTVLAGNPAANSTVYWSGQENPESWTPGTNLSGFQPLPDGGAITGLIGIDNYFLTFKRSLIYRSTFIGLPDIFVHDKIIEGTGCIAPDSLAQYGTRVFFLSERGFMMMNGGDPTPIGYEAIDQTFFSRYPRNELDKIYAVVDPRNHRYLVTMPGSPGQIYAYDWLLERWTIIELGLIGILSAFTSNISLDALDALYPGGLDTIPVSLDSPIFQGGEPRLYVVDPSGALGTLTGPNLAATFEWPFREVGIRARPFMGMPVTDCTSGMTLSLDARARLGDAQRLVARSSIRPSGHMPVRANGRYWKPRIVLEAGATWTYFQGIKFEYGTGGTR